EGDEVGAGGADGLLGLHLRELAHVRAARDEGGHALAERVVALDLLGGDRELDHVAGLVGLLLHDDVAAVVEVELEAAAADDGLVLHAAELPGGLGRVDLGERDAAVLVDDAAVVLLQLGHGEHVHEAHGGLVGRRDAAVDEHLAVADDALGLGHRVDDAKVVAQGDAQRDAVLGGVLAGDGLGDPRARLLGDLPGARGREPLHVERHQAASGDSSSAFLAFFLGLGSAGVASASDAPSFARRRGSERSSFVITRLLGSTARGFWVASALVTVTPSTVTLPERVLTSRTLPEVPAYSPRMTRTVSPTRSVALRVLYFRSRGSSRWLAMRARRSCTGALWSALRSFLGCVDNLVTSDDLAGGRRDARPPLGSLAGHGALDVAALGLTVGRHDDGRVVLELDPRAIGASERAL